MAEILVLGLGNRMMADDGVGEAVIERLRRSPPSDVCLEWAPDVLALPGLWRNEPEVWLVDAMVRGAAPGTVHRLDHSALLALDQRHRSAHQLSLPDGLRWIALAFPKMALVRYRLWGVEPEDLTPHRGLRTAVARAADKVTSEIVAALAIAGHLICD